jgi:hypothetical protein
LDLHVQGVLFEDELAIRQNLWPPDIHMRQRKARHEEKQPQHKSRP